MFDDTRGYPTRFENPPVDTSGYSVWVPDRHLESETTLARQEQFEVNALNAQLVEERHLGTTCVRPRTQGFTSWHDSCLGFFGDATNLKSQEDGEVEVTG